MLTNRQSPVTPWVLVVDDDADIHEGLAELLTTQGYRVHVATNGVEAIQTLEGAPTPCAIITDLVMAGIVGHELIDYLGSEQRLASVPVAIISGSPELAPAGHMVFTKPFAAGELLDFLRGRC